MKLNGFPKQIIGTLALLVLLGIFACGDGSDNDDNQPDTTQMTAPDTSAVEPEPEQIIAHLRNNRCQAGQYAFFSAE